MRGRRQGACGSCRISVAPCRPFLFRVLFEAKCCLHVAVDYVRMVQGLIAADPKIMMGKPTVAGTRIAVELILEKLAAGETVEQILAAHPRLTQAGIRAAIGFAAEVLGAEVVYPMDYVRT